MIIRDATVNDNLKMLDIQKHAAQIGEFEITLIKTDFRSKSNFFSDGFFLVAEDENTSDIIGFLGVGVDHFKVKDKAYKGAYLYDLRTNPKYMGSVAKWLKSITEETASRLRKMAIDFCFASVKADNQPSMKLLKHFNLTPIYSYITYAVPVFNKKIAEETKIEVDFDMVELEGFYSEMNHEIDFLPIGLENSFLKIMGNEHRLVKFSYKSAQIIGWDTRDIADIGVTNLSAKYKILIKTLYVTSKIIPFLKAPVLHKTMKSFRILKFDYEEEDDFKILLKTLNGYCYQNNFFLVIFFIPKNQSFNEKLLGKITFKTDLIVAANAVTNVDFSNLKNFLALPRL